MKPIISLIFSFILVPQTGFKKMTLLDGKVEFSITDNLSAISDETWKIKYHTLPKPAVAFSDENAEINLLVDITNQPASEDQLSSYKDFRIQNLKNTRSDVTFLSDGIKDVNGKKVGYIKFTSQAVDQKIFNYYFFTVANGKILFFTFNCIEKLQKTWEPNADKILESIKVK
ncbi:hypothetical protein FRZ67_16865 [Panacibacter ginsenosidivorans]|uniref:DUF1795 domain-containing protein n=1 Tax=Panacibacter ginsenosidivorans TaxID=1813871 RepID=A0A5B8VF02_9BACT|nr:hypothetical protein [Panacibacter ginsenosidivorans]QEC68898.1 hypothetical protein FRZ67_16865 [Panacibacter ginsenosidivorans]